jgi:oligopeptide transport system substrate-binding protein
MALAKMQCRANQQNETNGGINMSYFAKSLAAGFVMASIAAAPVLAAGTHPVTGEALADDQTFTYRLLDGIVSLDPPWVVFLPGG